MATSADTIIKVIVVLVWLLGVSYLLRKLKNIRSPVKERIMDVGAIGIIIFACGAVFHKFELTVAGSLIWAYGLALLLAEEYRKGKEESE